MCRDLHITTGVVTPFSPEVVQLRAPHHLTSISSGEVRQALRNLREHPDIERVLERIPRDPAHLTVHDVLFALEGWMRHRGHPGGILPEPNQEVEILAETDNPSASMVYLREHREHQPAPRYGAPPTAPLQTPLEQMRPYAESIRIRLPLLMESVGREIRRLSMRLSRM